MIDLAMLAADASEGSPCGSELTYDPAYVEFERLAKGRPEEQVGNATRAAVEPSWKELLPLGEGLLRKSKDLRIAVVIVRALVRTEGFDGLRQGLDLVAGLITRHWDCVHPAFDSEDDNDPTARISAFAPMVNAQFLLQDVREAALVRSRQHGHLLVRDVEVALGKIPALGRPVVVTEAQLDGALSAMVLEEPQVVASIAETFRSAKGLAALLDEKFGPALAPDLKPLLNTLYTLHHAFEKYAPVALLDPDTAADASAGVEKAGRGGDGLIRSRQDAVAMIDRIVEYLEVNEPTSPAPLLFRRGKRLMTMNFVDIFKELSPESMAKIDAIVGPSAKEE